MTVAVAKSNGTEARLSWLPSFPAHWRIEKGKRLFTKMERPTRDEDEVVTCFRDGQVTLRKNRRTEGFTESIKEIGYQGIRKGDLVIHAMDAFAGAIGVSDSDGKSTPVYSVCQPSADANPHYYAHLLREMSRAGLIVALARGIRERSTDFRFDAFGELELPIPPRPEQDAIVAYLDGKLDAIDRYLRVKEREIALLEERKRALIHRAVTRGLDPNPQLQPSGIPWLPEMPVGWEAVQLRRVVTRVKTGGTPPGATEDQFATEEGFPWFTPGDFANSDITMHESSRSLSDIGSRHCIRFPEDAVMMVGIGATIGKIGVPRREASCNQQINAIVPGAKVLPDFLGYFLVTQRDFIISCGKYTTMPILNQDDTKSLYVFVPPLSEQDAIANFIAQEVIDLDATITRARQQIERMQEYRTALIAEAVTGKFDVTNYSPSA